MATEWKLAGKYAIVTGAGGGIGCAFSEQLLKAGCSVILADLALRPESEDLLARFPHPPKEEGAASAVWRLMDQSDWGQISETWDFALETFPQVDLLCPAAGIWEPPSSGFWHPPGTAQSKDDPKSSKGVYNIFAVNAMGPIRFAQLALDHWLSRGIPGNLLLVSSQAAYLPTAGTPLYNATKASLVSFGQSLAQMRARLGVRVSVFCPGVTLTPQTQLEHCRHLVRPGDPSMTPAEAATAMVSVATAAEYGDGSVVEAMQFGAGGEGQASDVRLRAVPYQGLLPPIDPSGEFSGKNIMVQEEKLWAKLQASGMKV